MAYFFVKDYDGYVYDEGNEDFITPKGRIVEYPGGRFFGQVSVDVYDELATAAAEQEYEVTWDKVTQNIDLIKVEENDVTVEEVENLVENVEPTEEDVTEDYTARTWVVGDITINIVELP